MPILIKARKDFKETFEANNIRAYEYDELDYKGPCVVILPHQRYMRRAGTTKTLGRSWTVGLYLIVVGNKGQAPKNIDVLDALIEQVVKLVEPYCDVLEVGGPGKTTLNDGDYYGSVIEVEYSPVINE